MDVLRKSVLDSPTSDVKAITLRRLKPARCTFHDESCGDISGEKLTVVQESESRDDYLPIVFLRRQ